ncbi:hypothetical protein ISS07_05575 [Candidatus Woesearchaeota archaeon]|nr:hypothetical protein [Candidatus Woesearchaeota archaeon]
MEQLSLREIGYGDVMVQSPGQLIYEGPVRDKSWSFGKSELKQQSEIPLRLSLDGDNLKIFRKALQSPDSDYEQFSALIESMDPSHTYRGKEAGLDEDAFDILKGSPDWEQAGVRVFNLEGGRFIYFADSVMDCESTTLRDGLAKLTEEETEGLLSILS